MRLAVLFAASLLVCACGPFVYKIDVQQGNVVTQEAAAQLKTGMSKAEVRQLLGTPLLADVFHANRWDYYFSNARGGRQQERSLLSLHFKDEKLVGITGDARPATAGAAKPAAPAPAK